MAWRNCRQAGRRRAQGGEHTRGAFSAVCCEEKSQAHGCWQQPRQWRARPHSPSSRLAVSRGCSAAHSSPTCLIGSSMAPTFKRARRENSRSIRASAACHSASGAPTKYPCRPATRWAGQEQEGVQGRFNWLDGWLVADGQSQGLRQASHGWRRRCMAARAKGQLAAGRQAPPAQLAATPLTRILSLSCLSDWRAR